MKSSDDPEKKGGKKGEDIDSAYGDSFTPKSDPSQNSGNDDSPYGVGPQSQSPSQNSIPFQNIEQKNDLLIDDYATLFGTKAKPEKKSKTPLELDKQGFTFVEHLRPAGASGGSIDLYRYEGDDRAIVSLLHNGKLILKMQSKKSEEGIESENEKFSIRNEHVTYDNEWKNIADVLSVNNGDDDLHRPRLLAVQYEGKKFILNEYIYTDPSKERALNLEHYINALGEADRQVAASGENQLKKNETIAQRTRELDKIFESLVVSQNQLHKNGLLHLDTACRNFCVTPDKSLKIIDFGLSLKMDKLGKFPEICPYSIKPYYWLDQAACLSNKNPNYCLSIRTDYFARRVTMMEAMARYLGLLGNKAISSTIHDPGLPLDQEGGQPDLKKIKNDVRLKNSFNNLQIYASGLSASNDPRGDIVLKQLAKYENYLTHLPVGVDFASLRKNENAAFYQAQKGPALVADTPKTKRKIGLFQPKIDKENIDHKSNDENLPPKKRF